MNQTTYGRNQNGMMEKEIVPEARGKAAAISSYLAQGGGLTDKSGLMPGDKSGFMPGDKRTRGGQITRKGKVVHGSTPSPGERYTSGPMAGMTVDQATQKAEGMWAKSPDALKEKYASRSEGDLAPSEKKKYDEAKARQEARFNPAPAVRHVPMTSTTPAPLPGNSFADLTKAPVAPAGGIQSVGDGSRAANGWQPQTSTMPSPMGEHAKTVESYQHDPNDPNASAPKRTSPSSPTFILGTGPGGSYDSDQVRATRVAADSAKPLSSPADARRADDQRMMVKAPAPADLRRADDQRMMAASNPPALSQSAPTPPPLTAAPLAGPPISAMSAPATTTSPSPNINRLSGLPFGYRPGDSTAGLDPAKVGESNQRISTAMDQAVANAPRAIPVIAPTPSLRDQQSAAVAGYQKDLDPAKVAAMNQPYAAGTDLEKAQMVGDTLKRSAPLAQRDSALAASVRKPLTVLTRPQFARR